MTDDIKTDLDAELPSGRVPFELDTDRAVALGRSGRRRRNLIAGGGSVLSAIAVAGILVATLMPGVTSGGDQAADDEQAPRPELQADPPPKLDPDKDYTWTGPADGEEPTEATKGYTEAFWEHFEATYPGAEMYATTYVDSKSYIPDGPKAETGYFARSSMSLHEFDAGFMDGDSDNPEFNNGPLYERTFFSLFQAAGSDHPHDGSSPSLTIRFDPGSPTEDDIDVLVYQSGSFTRGTGDATDLAGCHIDVGYHQLTSCDVKDITGSNGEDMQQVSAKHRDDGAEPVEFSRMLVYYRDDGSAVVVRDTRSLRLSKDEPAPYLSYEQLADIATALPDTRVE